MGDLEEVRDQRVFDELGNIARNKLASNNDSNEEFKGFQNTWVENDVMDMLAWPVEGSHLPRATHTCCRTKGLSA